MPKSKKTVEASLGLTPSFKTSVGARFEGLVSNVDECVHLGIWHQYIFSVSLKFGAYYITGECGAFIKKYYLMLSYTF